MDHFEKQWKDDNTADDRRPGDLTYNPSRLSIPSALDQTTDGVDLKGKKQSGLSRLSEILKKALSEQFQHGKREQIIQLASVQPIVVPGQGIKALIYHLLFFLFGPPICIILVCFDKVRLL